MFRLGFRQNCTLLGGAAIAFKYELFEKVKEQMNTQTGIFTQETWFNICMYSECMGCKNIITPNSPFVKKDKSVENISLSRSFIDRWSSVLEKNDKNYNIEMDIFGKYYLIWK